MVANLPAGDSAELTIGFKVADEEEELSLYLKHWLIRQADSPASPVKDFIGYMLNIVINGNDAIMMHVDALQAGSGTTNISKIILRTTDYTSADFYDYIVMGYNEIVISIMPDPGSAPCGYALRAVAIS